MLCMFESSVLDAKVIYYKAKHDWSGFMAEEAMGMFALMVAMFG